MKKEEITMDDNQTHELNEDENDSTIVLYDEDGNEIELQILASRIHDGITYVLVVEEDEENSEVLHFKLIDDGDEDTIFEMVDEEHESFELVLDLFSEDYISLGIELTDIEL